MQQNMQCIMLSREQHLSMRAQLPSGCHQTQQRRRSLHTAHLFCSCHDAIRFQAFFYEVHSLISLIQVVHLHSADAQALATRASDNLHA